MPGPPSLDEAVSHAQVKRHFADRVEALQVHPERCRIVPELDRLGVLEYRELVIVPHSVFYRIRGRAVGIVSVLDRRRDLAEVLFRRML